MAKKQSEEELLPECPAQIERKEEEEHLEEGMDHFAIRATLTFLHDGSNGQWNYCRGSEVRGTDITVAVFRSVTALQLSVAQW